jgi:transposase
MARRAELFVRELSDEEAAHLLKQARRGKNAVVRHRAMLVFASFQGQSVSQISSMFQASATHVAALIHAFNEQGFPALDPRWDGGRPRRIDLDARTEIVKVALARPTDRGEPFTRWSLTKLRAHLVRARIVPSISRSQLWRILHEAGVRFTHHKTWKTSPDPEFETKKNRILDLYAHPPVGARVLCLDEFGPLNLQPRLGRGWHPLAKPARFRATYGRPACASSWPPTTLPPARCTVISTTARPGARSGSFCVRSGSLRRAPDRCPRQLQPAQEDRAAGVGRRTRHRARLHPDLFELAEPHRVPVRGPSLVRPQRLRLSEPC